MAHKWCPSLPVSRHSLASLESLSCEALADLALDCLDNLDMYREGSPKWQKAKRLQRLITEEQGAREAQIMAYEDREQWEELRGY